MAVGGAITILTVACGSAFGFGAVVERLATTDVTTHAWVAGATEVWPIRSVPQTNDQQYDGPPWASTGAATNGVTYPGVRKSDPLNGADAH